jgi:hypothetical protein
MRCALSARIFRKRVNWLLDADIRVFFTTAPSTEPAPS